MRLDEFDLEHIYYVGVCDCLVRTEDWSPLFAINVRDSDILGRALSCSLLFPVPLTSLFLSFALLFRHLKVHVQLRILDAGFRADREIYFAEF